MNKQSPVRCKMHCAMLNGIGRASGGKDGPTRAPPAMLPCIGFAQASAGDVKIIRHNDAVWWMALAWDGDEGRGKLR